MLLRMSALLSGDWRTAVQAEEPAKQNQLEEPSFTCILHQVSTVSG
jgi:hypothetical protein